MTTTKVHNHTNENFSRGWGSGYTMGPETHVKHEVRFRELVTSAPHNRNLGVARKINKKPNLEDASPEGTKGYRGGAPSAAVPLNRPSLTHSAGAGLPRPCFVRLSRFPKPLLNLFPEAPCPDNGIGNGTRQGDADNDVVCTTGRNI